MRKFNKLVGIFLSVMMLVGCRGGRAQMVTEGVTESDIVEKITIEQTTPEPTTVEETTTVDLQEFDFTMCFAGDILLAEGEITTNNLDNATNGLKDCIFLLLVIRETYPSACGRSRAGLHPWRYASL